MFVAIISDSKSNLSIDINILKKKKSLRRSNNYISYQDQTSPKIYNDYSSYQDQDEKKWYTKNNCVHHIVKHDNKASSFYCNKTFEFSFVKEHFEHCCKRNPNQLPQERNENKKNDQIWMKEYSDKHQAVWFVENHQNILSWQVVLHHFYYSFFFEMSQIHSILTLHVKISWNKWRFLIFTRTRMLPTYHTIWWNPCWHKFMTMIVVMNVILEGSSWLSLWPYSSKSICKFFVISTHFQCWVQVAWQFKAKSKLLLIDMLLRFHFCSFYINLLQMRVIINAIMYQCEKILWDPQEIQKKMWRNQVLCDEYFFLNYFPWIQESCVQGFKP